MPGTPIVTIARPDQEPVREDLLRHRSTSVAQMFADRVAASPSGVAFSYAAAPGAPDEGWTHVTWLQVAERVYRLAAGLISLGVTSQQRIAIASNTRYEWALADLTIMCSGAATTTIYPTTIPDDVGYILADSEAVAVFAEDAEQVTKLMSLRENIPEVARVIVMDGQVPPNSPQDWVMTLEDLERLGSQYLGEHPNAVNERIAAISSDQLATLIYTSGTTGRPKGVRLIHGNWTYQGAACQAIDIIRESDVQYLWLPLAHVFGKQLLTINLQIGFATAIDGRIDKIVDNLAVVQPTFMGAAPRIFEKAHARIVGLMDKESGLRRRLFHWAVDVGSRVFDAHQAGRQPGLATRAQFAIADRLVLSKIRARFGGNIRFFISGSAPLNADIARWFGSVGLLICEGYGLTESSSAAFVNRTHAYQAGTVGWPLPQLDAKIADDGEILLRGDGIMVGYHNDPEATAAVLIDGWFHTGDIGEIDDHGYLQVTDRKKDLFKTSGGKYVAPSVIESTFKALCPYASQLLVYGASRNYVTALVALDEEAITTWAHENDVKAANYAELVSSDRVRELVAGYIDRLNAGLNRWEQIKHFAILDHDLTVEGGELTPSLKLRRSVVTKRNADVLSSLYEDS